MISSTTSLYFGAENSIQRRCPNGVNILSTFTSVDGVEEENLERLREVIRTYSGEEADLTGVRACEVSGIIMENGILINYETMGTVLETTDYDYKNGYLSVISLDDYNHMMKTEQTLSDGECLLYSSIYDYATDTFTMEYGETYEVKEIIDEFMVDGDTSAMVVPTVYLVVEDIYGFVEPVKDMKNEEDYSVMVYDWRCGFDAENEEEEAQAVLSLKEDFQNLEGEDVIKGSYDAYSREEKRDGFYDMYGSLFFLGIMLSIVFLFAAVLIIYYKQISEGYEDYSRFDIMQKVGMTKRDIRKSINSQMLTVFFLPLIFAGIHLAFAFPSTMKIFRMFAFDNTMLGITVNLTCFAVFGILYALVYKITSNAYSTIVSGQRRA